MINTLLAPMSMDVFHFPAYAARPHPRSKRSLPFSNCASAFHQVSKVRMVSASPYTPAPQVEFELKPDLDFQKPARGI